MWWAEIDDICPLIIPNWISRISMQIDIYPSYCPEMKIRTNRHTTDRWIDGHTADQCETIISYHYHVEGGGVKNDVFSCKIFCSVTIQDFLKTKSVKMRPKASAGKLLNTHSKISMSQIYSLCYKFFYTHVR